MPPRMLSDEELESVRLTELAEAPNRRDPRVRAAETHLQPTEGQVKLWCPRHATCSFGPGDSRGGASDRLIKFGEVEEHVAIVAADHPLLADLRKRKPYVVLLEPGETPGKVYTCEECDREFPSKRSLANHRKGGHPVTPEPAARRRPTKAQDSTED